MTRKLIAPSGTDAATSPSKPSSALGSKPGKRPLNAPSLPGKPTIKDITPEQLEALRKPPARDELPPEEQAIVHRNMMMMGLIPKSVAEGAATERHLPKRDLEAESSSPYLHLIGTTVSEMLEHDGELAVRKRAEHADWSYEELMKLKRFAATFTLDEVRSITWDAALAGLAMDGSIMVEVAQFEDAQLRDELFDTVVREQQTLGSFLNSVGFRRATAATRKVAPTPPAIQQSSSKAASTNSVGTPRPQTSNSGKLQNKPVSGALAMVNASASGPAPAEVRAKLGERAREVHTIAVMGGVDEVYRLHEIGHIVSLVKDVAVYGAGGVEALARMSSVDGVRLSASRLYRCAQFESGFTKTEIDELLVRAGAVRFALAPSILLEASAIADHDQRIAAVTRVIDERQTVLEFRREQKEAKGEAPKNKKKTFSHLVTATAAVAGFQSTILRALELAKEATPSDPLFNEELACLDKALRSMESAVFQALDGLKQVGGDLRAAAGSEPDGES
jgi:hypothetical protein